MGENIVVALSPSKSFLAVILFHATSLREDVEVIASRYDNPSPPPPPPLELTHIVTLKQYSLWVRDIYVRPRVTDTRRESYQIRGRIYISTIGALVIEKPQRHRNAK